MLTLLESYEGPSASDDTSKGWNTLFMNVCINIILYRYQVKLTLRIGTWPDGNQSAQLQGWACIKIENVNTIDERRSKIVRDRVFDYHMSPDCQQMAIENTVYSDF